MCQIFSISLGLSGHSLLTSTVLDLNYISAGQVQFQVFQTLFPSFSTSLAVRNTDHKGHYLSMRLTKFVKKTKTVTLHLKKIMVLTVTPHQMLIIEEGMIDAKELKETFIIRCIFEQTVHYRRK